MIVPNSNYVFCIRQEREEEDVGGIIIPGTEESKFAELSYLGIVTARGEGRTNKRGRRVPVRLSINDKIVLPRWGTTEFKHEGTTYTAVRDENILGVGDFEDYENVQAYSDFLYLRKCTNYDEVDGQSMVGGIIIPQVADDCHYAELISIGHKCTKFFPEMLRMFVELPENAPSLQTVDPECEYWFIRESEVAGSICM